MTGNPYPGLRPFERDDAHLFFGRDKPVNELVALLARNRFLAIVGVSGSGKSSLVKATAARTASRRDGRGFSGLARGGDDSRWGSTRRALQSSEQR